MMPNPKTAAADTPKKPPGKMTQIAAQSYTLLFDGLLPIVIAPEVTPMAEKDAEDAATTLVILVF